MGAKLFKLLCLMTPAMANYQELQQEAQKRLQTADHMLHVTYPSVKEPKILVAVLGHLFHSLAAAIAALVAYERQFKRVPPYPQSFIGEFEVFRKHCVPDYGIPLAMVKLIQDVHETVQLGPGHIVVEGQQLRELQSQWGTKTISPGTLGAYLGQGKSFLLSVDTILKQNQEVFEASVRGISHGRRV